MTGPTSYPASTGLLELIGVLKAGNARIAYYDRFTSCIINFTCTCPQGLDTAEPVLQLENYVFRGRYEGRSLSRCAAVQQSFISCALTLFW